MEHKVIQSGEIHVPHNWKYPNQAARLSATITDPSEIDKLALQASDGTYWRLTQVNPAQWVPAIGPQGEPFRVNETGLFSERSNYDNQPSGFSFLATDQSLLYFRETDTPGVWSEGIEFGKGEPGDNGVGVPVGGTTGQFLVKTTDNDYETNWQTVDKTTVGLGNVDNTADLAKPISTATQEALDEKADEADVTSALGLKVDKVAGKELSDNNFSDADKTKLDNIAPNATANQSDTYLLDRANHTGTQAISTITGLQTALDAKANDADLGDAAYKDTGTTAGTVASGDDSRIVNALDKTILTTEGDLIIADSSGAPTRLPKGAPGTVVGVNDNGDVEYVVPQSSGAVGPNDQNYFNVQVAGAISDDYTLETGNNYLRIGPLVIPDGITLTIEPGAILKVI